MSYKQGCRRLIGTLLTNGFGSASPLHHTSYIAMGLNW